MNGRGGRARAMSAVEMEACIAGNVWGVLALTADGAPYAVPTVFAYDGASFYVANGEGKKTRALRERPEVCLTITEVRGERAERWSSVLVRGRVEWIDDVDGKLRVFDLLRSQFGASAPRLRDPDRAARAPVFRIVEVERTGRTTEPPPDAGQA